MQFEPCAELGKSATGDINAHHLALHGRGAEEYGRIFAELRRAGRPIQQIDMQIGAVARTLPNCVVVTKDSDLGAISGVRIENWAV